MRISDWSSDVCSFYLCRDASLASPRRRREGEGESAMRRARSAAVAVCLLGGLLGGLSGTVGGGIAAAGAQENPMLGSWTAVDPGTGIHDVLTITPDDLAFGSAQAAVPYRFEETGDGLAVYLGEAEDPARFIFLDDINARLSVPGRPSIALRRNGPTPAAQTPATEKPARSEEHT